MSYILLKLVSLGSLPYMAGILGEVSRYSTFFLCVAFHGVIEEVGPLKSESQNSKPQRMS